MVALSGLLAGLVLLVLLSRPGDGRLAHAVPHPGWSGSPARGRRPIGPRDPERVTRPPVLSMQGTACLLLGAATGLLLPLPLGPLAGAAVALAGPRVLGRLEPRAVRAERERLVSDLPLLLDLLASCLAGGASLAGAADAVARAVPGPAGRRMAAVGAALAVGSPPADAWAALASAVPGDSLAPGDPLGPASRALARAADGGAPVAQAVSRIAADARAEARSRGEQAARRVGVLAVAPLGLCFLPAFVLLGVVPVVAGLAGPLLGSL
ncbi:MAG: type II secretion system F family protein [Mycobacteriales bacterium]